MVLLASARVAVTVAHNDTNQYHGLHAGVSMNVRWMAVFTGYLVDIFITLLIQLFAGQSMLENPDLTRTDHLVVIALLTLSTGIGGYVAGRMARTDRALNGFLVAIVGILLNQLGGSLPRVLVLASVVACGLAALGGFLSRFPAERGQRSPQ
jgi:putative membrane protein (TIGR04086 family)